MAIDFGEDPANFLSRSASLISNTDPRPMSIHICIKSTVTGAASGTIYAPFTNNYAAGGPAYLAVIRGAGGTTAAMGFYNGDYMSNSSSFSMSTTEYESYLWTIVDASPNDSNEYFRNGASIGNPNRGNTGTTTDGCAIGTLQGTVGGFELPEVCNFAAWNVQLDVNDAVALSAGVSPDQVRPQNLVAYVPMFDNSGNDLIQSAWTKNGTLNATSHARTFMRSAQILQFPPAGAAPAGNAPTGGLYGPLYGSLAGPV